MWVKAVQASAGGEFVDGSSSGIAVELGER